MSVHPLNEIAAEMTSLYSFLSPPPPQRQGEDIQRKVDLTEIMAFTEITVRKWKPTNKTFKKKNKKR